jgi:hypothetical protein
VLLLLRKGIAPHIVVRNGQIPEVFGTKMPVFSVGDLIRNTCSREQGRVVRTVPLAHILQKLRPYQLKHSAYIVSLPPGPYTPAREVLWFPSEVEAGDDRAAKDTTRNQTAENTV